LLCIALPRSPTSTLFPYTTLFRSGVREQGPGAATPCPEIFHIAKPQALHLEANGFKPADHQILTAIIGRRDRTSANQVAGQLKRSEEHTSELQSRENLVCRLLLEK